MASFEPRGNSIRVVVRLPGGGKISQTFDNTREGKVEANAWARKMDAMKGASATAAAMTGVTCGELWEVYEPVAARSDTGRWNTLRLNAFGRDPLAKRPVAKVTTEDINDWILRQLARESARGETIAPSTVARELNLLSASFNHAVKVKKWITVNPCHGAMALPAKAVRKPATLQPKQIEAVCAAAGLQQDPGLTTIAARTCVAWLVALETGMRSGEILRVRPEHYWRAKKTVHVAAEERGGRKGSKSGTKVASRNVPLTARAIELWDWLLRTMPREQDAAALASCGMLKPLYILGLTDAQRDANWRKLAKRAGLENFTYHDAKHEACTRLAPHLDIIELSHAVGTKDLALLRDTYYIADASRSAARLPARLVG